MPARAWTVYVPALAIGGIGALSLISVSVIAFSTPGVAEMIAPGATWITVGAAMLWIARTMFVSARTRARATEAPDQVTALESRALAARWVRTIGPDTLRHRRVLLLVCAGGGVAITQKRLRQFLTNGTTEARDRVDLILADSTEVIGVTFRGEPLDAPDHPGPVRFRSAIALDWLMNNHMAMLNESQMRRLFGGVLEAASRV